MPQRYWLLCLTVSMFLGTIPLALAQKQISGSWTAGVDKTSGFFYASTINDSGALLGEYCYLSSKSCIWILGMDTACKERHQYPVLVNSDFKVVQLEVLCNAKLESGIHRYVFTNFNAIDDIVMKGLRVGLAFPLKGVQFKVVYFNLAGSKSAINIMKNSFENATKPSAPQAGTKDQIM